MSGTREQLSVPTSRHVCLHQVRNAASAQTKSLPTHILVRHRRTIRSYQHMEFGSIPSEDALLVEDLLDCGRAVYYYDCVVHYLELRKVEVSFPSK